MKRHTARLQQRLQDIYQLDVAYHVDDFITTDAAFAASHDGGRGGDEKLLVREDGDALDVSLYLNSELVARLDRDDPHARLHDGNWADFCTALEGVSHFLYLSWNAERQRSVRPVELEMQAEVDKYVVSVSLFGGQRAGRVPRRLHPWLFDEFTLAVELNAAERTRYRDANRYAGKYCSVLERRYLKGVGLDRARAPDLLSELRRFYRLPLQQKIRRIDALRA